MKKLLLIMLATVAVLTGCKKEDSTNVDFVTGVQLPPLTEQFAQGASITVQGSGFTQADEIVFRTQTKATTDILAIITNVNDTQITFIVPAGLPAGENNVIVKRDNVEQVLGKITIAEATPMTLYGVGYKDEHGYGKQTELYQIDPTTGAVTHLTTFPGDQDLSQSLAINHTIYAIGSPAEDSDNRSNQSIVGYNLDTKEFKKLSDRISDEDYYDVLGVIDGKLHALSCVGGTIKLSSIDAATGAKTEVANFGKIQDSPYFDGFLVESAGFAYDATNKKIVMGGYWDGPSEDGYVKTVVLDISKNTIEYFAVESDIFEHECFMRGSQVCRMYEYWRESDDAVFMVVETLDNQYKMSGKIASISDVTCITYDAAQDMVYGFSGAGFFSSELKNSAETFKIIAAGGVKKIRELVVVR